MRIHGIHTIICVVAAGAIFGLAVTLPAVLAQSPAPPPSPTHDLAPPEGQVLALRAATALQYARAMQDGDCDDVIALTAWMADRIRRVSLQAGGPDALDQAREHLCDQVRRRPVEGNQLRAEGIEDEYVFAPGTQLEVVAIDEGRDDLDRAIEQRVWIRVTYPRRATAPLAPAAGAGVPLQPVHAWTVGVNVSQDDTCVVKANVIGNLEVDPDSIAFDWPRE